MPKPFDAVSKTLLEAHPEDWARFFGDVPTLVEVIDADASAVTSATDKVLRVTTAAGRHLDAIDFQAGPDASVPRRACLYSVVLTGRHDLPVRSHVVLLRPEANLTTINGVYEIALPAATTAPVVQAAQVVRRRRRGRRSSPAPAPPPREEPYLRFRYNVIRVWEQPAEAFLNAGLGLVPLALLTDDAVGRLPTVVDRMRERVDAEVPEAQRKDIWSATKILLGLRYEAATIDVLLQGVRQMRESTTYMAILEEGATERDRVRLRTLGTALLTTCEREFGPASDLDRARLESLPSFERYIELNERSRRVRSWAELLADEP